MNEEQYKKELADSGVDLPELTPANAPEADNPQENPKESEAEETEAPKIEESIEEQKPSETKKRSIYDEYKDKKSELKTEKERREQAEHERDELKQKLEAVSTADTQQERQEAKDDLERFALDKGLDPESIRQMRDLFLKDVKTSIDPSIQEKLDKTLAFIEKNSQAIDKQEFENEFQSDAVPAIKEFFPNITNEDLSKVKNELDKLAHTKGFEDKSLDYIVYKNRSKLSTLVTPKKRGIEGKSRADAVEINSDFDMNPDFSRMTSTQIRDWETQYNSLTKNDGLSTGVNGRKIIV